MNIMSIFDGLIMLTHITPDLFPIQSYVVHLLNGEHNEAIEAKDKPFFLR